MKGGKEHERRDPNGTHEQNLPSLRLVAEQWGAALNNNFTDLAKELRREDEQPSLFEL